MATEKRYKFTQAAAKRIVAATRMVEERLAIRNRSAGGMVGGRDRGGVGGGQTTIFLLRVDGGAAGGDGDFCSFTYSVWNVGDDPDTDPPIAVGVAMQGKGNGWRSLPTELSSATEGEGYMDSDGTTFILLEPYEGPATFFQCLE